MAKGMGILISFPSEGSISCRTHSCVYVLILSALYTPFGLASLILAPGTSLKKSFLEKCGAVTNFS